MRKRAFIVILQLIVAIASCKFCYAQEIRYSENPERILYSYRNSLALSDGKILVVYGKSNWVKLSSTLLLTVHGKDGSVLVEKTVPLHNFGFALYFKDAFIVKGNVYFLCVNDIKRTDDYNYVLVKLNTDSLNIHVVDQMQFGNLPASWLISGEYHLCFSPDSSLIGFVTVSPMKPDFTKTASVTIADMNELKISSSSLIQLGTNANTFQMKDIAITNNGNVLMLVKYYINGGTEVSENKSGYKYILELYAYGKLKRSVNVTPEANLMRDAVMQINKNNRKVMVAAYETKVNAEEPTGIRLYEVNIDSMSLIRTSFINWAPDVDTNVVGFGSYKISIDYNYPYFIFLDNEKFIPVEGARITHNFNFYRGKLVCLETDSLLKEIGLKEIKKYQFLEEMPEKSFAFDRSNSTVSYVQNENGNGKELMCFYNINTGLETKQELNHEFWDVKKSYHLLFINNDVTLIQPQIKDYVLVKIKLK